MVLFDPSDSSCSIIFKFGLIKSPDGVLNRVGEGRPTEIPVGATAEGYEPAAERSDAERTDEPISVGQASAAPRGFTHVEPHKPEPPRARPWVVWDPNAEPTGPYVPNPNLPARPSAATLRWADANVLGGRRAFLQFWAVVWDSIREGRRRLDEQEAVERARALFPSMEAHIDDELLDAVSETILPRKGEGLEDYDERLRTFVGIARHRVDGLPSATSNSEGADARASYDPSVAEGKKSPPVAFVLTRQERSRINRRFWAEHRRKPTQEELDAIVARERAAGQ